MTDTEPIGELDPAFSSPNAPLTPWADARRQLQAAEIFWLSTVRPDGRPLEGDAVRTSEEAILKRVADAYASKYGDPFVFTVRDGAFRNDESGEALVFRVAPRKAFGFGKGDIFSQTRWRFEVPAAKG